MRQAEKLTITCDGAVVSFEEIEWDASAPWDAIPDVREHLAWAVDDIRWALSAVLITLESGDERKRLYSFDDRTPNAVTEGSALCIGSDIIYVQGPYAARLNVANGASPGVSRWAG